MSDFFLRKSELIIGEESFNSPPFKIDYDINFDTDPEPNEGSIKIYNLSQETISNFKKDSPIILNAGYGEDIGSICNGVITNVFNSIKNGVDGVTEIQFLDVTSQFLTNRISKTFAPIKASELLKELFQSTGIKPTEIELENDIYYKNGFTALGKRRDIIKKVVEECKSELIINNNSISILKKTSGVESGYLLSAETGLLDVRKIEVKRNGAEYKLEMFLNHGVTCKSILQVESKTLDATVVVVAGKHQNSKTKVEVKVIG